MLIHLYWPFSVIKPTLYEVLPDGKLALVPHDVLIARSNAAFVQAGKNQTGQFIVLETGQQCDLAAAASPWSFRTDLTEIGFFLPDLSKPEAHQPTTELFFGLMLFTEGVPHMPRWKEINAKLQTDRAFAARLYKDIVGKFIQSKSPSDVSALTGRMMALNRSPVFYKLFEEYHEGLL